MSILLLLASARAAEVGLEGYVGHWALPAESELPPAYVGGLRIRYRWTELYAVEVGGGLSPGGADGRAELLRFFDNPSMVTPFLAGGVGGVSDGASTTLFAGLGGGVDAELAPWIDFRTDLRLRLLGESTPTVSALIDTGLMVHTARVHDRDADGIADRQDTCPNEAEDKDSFEDADGCPEADNDKDGLLDAADTCPIEPEDGDGFEDTDGCPDPDNDKDGLADTADKCVGDPEDKDSFQDEDGCPDNDNDQDGLPDGTDKCPNEPETLNGFRDKDGCADEVPKEVEKFSGVIAGVNFETNKTVLLPSSKKVLDEAVTVLAQFPEVRLEVQGHTDDVGDDAKNLKLSQGRAESVVAYLVSKGIAADRLVAKGYGETAPKVANDSSANRAVNRRVEFKRL